MQPITRPTIVRYKVLALLAAMTFVLYIDRVCIAQAAPEIQRDLGISSTQMGFVFAAFTLAYGLFEVPTGWLADKHGSRRILTRIVICWSVFTALTGAVTGFWMLIAVRFLFGAGEAGALPSAVRIVTRWFPPSFRGRAQGTITTFMVIGGAIAPIAAAKLIGLFGWRWAFVMFGCLGVVWATVFYLWFRDEPAEHREPNQAELDLIRAGQTSIANEPHPPIPWYEVAFSRNVWLLGTLMTCASAVFYVFISWYPNYLQKARDLSRDDSGWLSTMVLAGGALGCIGGGVLTDLIYRRTNNAFVARNLIGTISYVVGGSSMVIGMLFDSPILSAACAMVTVFCIQIQIPAWWATVMSISGRHVGALSGLMNSMGVFGAMASQILIGYVVDFLGNRGAIGRSAWDPPLYAIGGIMAVGAVLWLLVDPNAKPVGEQTDFDNERADYGDERG